MSHTQGAAGWVAMAGMDAYAAIAELLHKSQVSHYTKDGARVGASHSRPTQQRKGGAYGAIPGPVILKPRDHPAACLCDAGCLGWWKGHAWVGTGWGAPAHQ